MPPAPRLRGAGWFVGTLLAVHASLASGQPAPPPSPLPSPSPSLTLRDALRLALTRNERVGIAAASRGQAEARLDLARAFFFPEVVAQGSLTRRAREVVRNDAVIQSLYAWNGNVTATVPLFDARGFPLYRAARLERDAARIDEREARRLLTFEVADAYLQTLTQTQVVSAAERRRDLAQLRLADARGRAGARLVGGNDVTLAELEAATAERERIEAATQLTTAYGNLGLLIGADVAGPLAPVGDVLAGATSLPGSDDELVAAARAGRRDLAAARLRVDAARAAADEPPRRAWPSLGLTGQARATNEAGFSGHNFDWSLALTATWILWDGGARAAEARQRELAAAAAALGVQAQERSISTEARTAAATLRGAQAGREQAAAAAAAAGRNADEVAILYRQGLARAIEVADAGGRRFDAEVALARAELTLGLAYLDVLAATGQAPVSEVVP